MRMRLPALTSMSQIKRDLLSQERSEESPAVAIALEAWIDDNVP